MMTSANKQVFFVAIVLVVIGLNAILQITVQQEEAHSSDEEKILAKIRAMRQELHNLEVAEGLLRKDSANFMHPDVLSSLHITEEERSDATQTIVPGDNAATAAPPAHVIPPPARTPPASPTTSLPPQKAAEDASPPGSTHHLTSVLPPASPATNNVLVVGGTDGSGTRRVVQLLTKLGVTVVSEDPETYDLHADLFGGWPEVVTPVLQASGSISALPSSYPAPLRSRVLSSLDKLVRKAAADAKKPQSFKLAKGGALETPPGTHASRVKFGFKAPVAMTLVPWWLEVADRVMFLHVLRDGRDISFSANQGPVNKFFAPMYNKRGDGAPLQGPVSSKAMKLWADWNNGLREWAEKRQGGGSGERGQLDYLQLHVEDLLHDRLEVRLGAIARVARWVGSDLDDDALCCLAVEGSTFMGSHDRAGKIGGSGEARLKSKYGKWRAKFQADPQLERAVMQWGEAALRDLGYLQAEEQYEESVKSFQQRMTGSYECSLSRAQCSAKALGRPRWWTPAPPPPHHSPGAAAALLCSFQDGLDYRGQGRGGVDLSSVPAADPDACCRECRALSGCRFFTFAREGELCYLKKGRGTELRDESTTSLVSGATL